MFRKRSTPSTSPTSPAAAPVERITSVLGSGATWKGNLGGSGGVRIEGTFEGEVALRGLLVVGETGLILGERFSSGEFAEEVFRRWRDSDGRLAESMQALGEDLAAARRAYLDVKQLDDTLFAKDYETL